MNKYVLIFVLIIIIGVALKTNVLTKLKNKINYIIADSRTLKNIDSLHPLIREDVKKFIYDLKNQKIDFLIYEGFRTMEQQAMDYGKGRTCAEVEKVGLSCKYSDRGKAIITNAPPGLSYHNYGLAFDGVQLINGSPDWNYTNADLINSTAFKYGFTNGKSFGDKPHFESQKYGDIHDLMADLKQGIYPILT